MVTCLSGIDKERILLSLRWLRKWVLSLRDRQAKGTCLSGTKKEMTYQKPVSLGKTKRGYPSFQDRQGGEIHASLGQTKRRYLFLWDRQGEYAGLSGTSKESMPIFLGRKESIPESLGRKESMTPSLGQISGWYTWLSGTEEEKIPLYLGQIMKGYMSLWDKQREYTPLLEESKVYLYPWEERRVYMCLLDRQGD